MKRRLPIIRIVVGMVAGVLLIAGLDFIDDARRIERRIDTQSQAIPLDMPIDLSVPGRYIAPFKQTWQSCHGQSIMLQIPATKDGLIPARQACESLQLHWEITDSEGVSVADGKVLGSNLLDTKINDGRIVLASFYPFDLGDYKLTCEVLHPALALTGVEQRLISEYQPCGMERLPGMMINAVGVVAVLGGGIVGLFVIWYSIASRFGLNSQDGRE